jgi:hypothetical protein
MGRAQQPYRGIAADTEAQVTLPACVQHLVRIKRTHPCPPMISNLIQAAKSYPRATGERRRDIAKYMESVMQILECAVEGRFHAA